MSVNAGGAAPRPHAASKVRIREHAIPSANSAPYICVEERIGTCGSAKAEPQKSAASIRAAPRLRSLPCQRRTPHRIGIDLGADGNLWFAQKRANKIGRISTDGILTEFAVPTENAGPDAIARRPPQCIAFGNGRGSDWTHHTGRQDLGIQGRSFHRRQQTALDCRARRRALVRRARPAIGSAASPSTAR